MIILTCKPSICFRGHPPHMLKFVTRMAVKMHSDLEDWG